MDGVLVYGGDDQPPVVRVSSHPPSTIPLTDITNSINLLTEPSASHSQSLTVAAEATPRKPRESIAVAGLSAYPASSATASEARTPGGRKRKVPANTTTDPITTPARLFSADLVTTPSSHAGADADSESQTGRTRRVRKSINYALPKLNTKMRKPDPTDLVPASTPHRSTTNTPSSARGMVGSTGNLSDIRKLHEAAAMRQSPAERTSMMRSTGSPGRSGNAGEDDGSVRMADLFEIRERADRVAAHNANVRTKQRSAPGFWAVDGITDTSDDDSRVTSNADLGELAELEAAMSDLCTSDEARQVDTPRAPQHSAWPSRPVAQMSASSSANSVTSITSDGSASKRPSLRRKTTTLPSRSRQSSVEQALQTEVKPQSSSKTLREKTITGLDIEKATGTKSLTASATATTKAPATSHKTAAERARPGSAASTSTELGNGRPTMSSGGLAAGMKPKQRPASAGAALVGSRSTSASSSAGGDGSADRPRTFSGTTSANAGLTQTAHSNGIGRASPSTSGQRTSLHSALTNRGKAMPASPLHRLVLRACRHR